MNDMDAFERRFEDRVRAFAKAGVRPLDSAAVARAAAVDHPRSIRAGSAVPRLGFTLDRRAWAVVLALGLLVALLGGALLVGAGLVPPTLVDTSIPVRPSPNQPAVVAPSATPTATPSPTPPPILWTQASLEEDWPAPVRSEPVGGGIVEKAIVKNSAPATYSDPAGDVDASMPWIDIRQLTISRNRLIIGLAVNVMPVVDPTEQWIAYGVVWDTDRDGVPDLRFGGDNPPSEDGHRVWITELHSGRTVVNPGGGYFEETFYDKFFEVFLPIDYWHGARLTFGGETAGPGPNGGGIVGGLHSPFYAWASVIQDGRVVATDYAPDSGWLDPEP